LRRGAHPEDTGLSTFERPRPLSDGVGIRQQTTGSPQQVVALGGDLNAPPDAIEEPDVQLVLEGVNLTNEVNDQFISRARNSAVVYSVTGREYLFGVRVSF